VARTFGDKFAAGIDALEPGLWGGPVESSYGLHLVLITERVAAAGPALADVRPLVVRELLAERSRTQLDEIYKSLLAKYTVTVEMPAEPEPKQAAASPPGSQR
jgi:parvulin-like peptidyl-prolyl isomerase